MARTKRYAEAEAVRAAADGDHSFGTGLLLRCRGAAASWVFRYTAPSGRRREMGLGAVERASIADAERSLYRARADAHEARELLRKYRDPLEERREARAAARAAAQSVAAAKRAEEWTLARCAREYHRREVEPSGVSSQHAAEWIASLANHVPSALWNAPIASITAPALLEGLRQAKPSERARREVDLSVTMGRVRQRLDLVFKDAMFHGRCLGNPAAAIGIKLCNARPKSKPEPLQALDYRQAPAFAARLRATSWTAARCLEFAMLTAARTNEALLAEWSEFDLAAAVWLIPRTRMKKDEEHTVYLSQRAVEIVRGQVGQSARWVFPSVRDNDRPMNGAALLETLGRLGMRDRTTVHGLRATFSTWANDTAAGRPDVIEACLAHAEENRVRRAYNRAEFAAERRALLEAWSTYLAAPAALQVVGGVA